jgi:hypothetical protein
MRWQAQFDMTILLHHSHSRRKCVELRPLSIALRHHSSDQQRLRWYIMINGQWFRGIGRVEAAATGAHSAITFHPEKCSEINWPILKFVSLIPFLIAGS